jgi:flagellum-specific ATP synthase
MQQLEMLARTTAALSQTPLVSISGRVIGVAPGIITVAGLSQFARLGDRVCFDRIETDTWGEVVHIEASRVLVAPVDEQPIVGIGTRAILAGPLTLAPSYSWRGRVISATGAPLDDLGPLPAGSTSVNLNASPPPALTRGRVNVPVRTGVRAVDLLMPLCRGQRIGVFAGSGVGKSTLLGMLAQAPGFDSVVVGLIGERGREVREFLEDVLGERRAQTIAVVSTGDESPVKRCMAARTAVTMAEWLRDRGESVLLILDSVTRFAHAAREVALKAGEPPVSRGYTPSVFSEIPRLLERAGPGGKSGGSITAVVSVLVDGDDHNDPIADCIRGIVDGHIVLDRAVADRGRFPAINLQTSISRLAQHVWTPEQAKLVMQLKAMITRYEESRDLRALGGYQRGGDIDLDQAVDLIPKLYGALTQRPDDPASIDPFRELANALQPG